MIEDLVHFDGVITRDGVIGGRDGDLHRHWDRNSTKYDPEIVQCMSSTRYHEIK